MMDEATEDIVDVDEVASAGEFIDSNVDPVDEAVDIFTFGVNDDDIFVVFIYGRSF